MRALLVDFTEAEGFPGEEGQFQASAFLRVCLVRWVRKDLSSDKAHWLSLLWRNHNLFVATKSECSQTTV